MEECLIPNKEYAGIQANPGYGRLHHWYHAGREKRSLYIYAVSPDQFSFRVFLSMHPFPSARQGQGILHIPGKNVPKAEETQQEDKNHGCCPCKYSPNSEESYFQSCRRRAAQPRIPICSGYHIQYIPRQTIL